MSAKDRNFMMGLDRLNALFTWWGVPNVNANRETDDQLRRLQTFTSDLQKALGAAYSYQTEALYTASEQVAGSLQAFAHCPQPQDVIALGSNVLATILEGASLQAKSWIDLTQKVQDCCAEIARESAAESCSPANAGSHTTRPLKAASPHAESFVEIMSPPRTADALASALPVN